MTGRAAIREGTRRGIFLAHAMFSPAAAVILLGTGHFWLAGMMAVGAILGWLGLRDTRPIPPGES